MSPRSSRWLRHFAAPLPVAPFSTLPKRIRQRILQEHGRGVLPDCYTGRCTCNFVDSLKRDVPDSMLETAIYTRDDGIVDWRYCMTRNPEVDFEVPGTHIGMAFNPSAYTIVAERLAKAQSSE